MTGLASVLAVALAVIFAWAAITKLIDSSGTQRGFSELGLPASDLLSRVVPVTELITAGLLLVLPGWGGVAAFSLLAAFTVVLVVTVRSGKIVPCRCFGGTTDAPVSWLQVFRNVWLLVFAVAATLVDRLRWPSPSALAIAILLLCVGPITAAVVESRSKVQR